MGGLSLWLCPPKGSDLEKKLQKLIDENVPKHFSGRCPQFRPHITITSEIPTTVDPKELIDSIPTSPTDSAPLVIFRRVRVGTAFWTRTALELEKTPSLLDLAVECRARFVLEGDYDAAREWADKYTTPAESGEQGFIPHLSLAYSDEEVGDEVGKAVEEDVRAAGIALSDGGDSGDGEVSGWEGGRILLVPTNKPMPFWNTPLAEKSF